MRHCVSECAFANCGFQGYVLIAIFFSAAVRRYRFFFWSIILHTHFRFRLRKKGTDCAFRQWDEFFISFCMLWGLVWHSDLVFASRLAAVAIFIWSRTHTRAVRLNLAMRSGELVRVGRELETECV